MITLNCNFYRQESGKHVKDAHYNQLMVELRREDPASFQNFLRIQSEMFDELLARVGPRITKHDTNYRKALDPGTKLAATLRHLASGDTYASM